MLVDEASLVADMAAAEMKVNSKWVQLLNEILSWWPKRGDDEVRGRQRLYDQYLAADFDESDFYNYVGSVVAVTKVDVADNFVTIVFSDSDNSIQRAILELPRTGVWRLRSMKFQCPVCFGDGVNDGASCVMCGGTGLGPQSDHKT